MAREYIDLHNVKVKWPNFSGQKSTFNPNGHRTFNIILDEQVANDLRDRGLNIKTHLNSSGEDPLYTLQATISFSPYPPDEVYRIIPKGKIRLTEETIGALDHEDIDHIDVKLALSRWEMGNNSGIKPYVSKMAVWVNEDRFADSYRDIPEIGGVIADTSAYDDGVDDGEMPF